MAITQINVGAAANDGTGDTLRSAGVKINGNFSDSTNAASKAVVSSATDVIADRVLTTGYDVTKLSSVDSLAYQGDLTTTSGTADAIELTGVNATITAYSFGQKFRFYASANNTSTVTVDIDGVGALPINGVVSPDTIISGQEYELTVASGATAFDISNFATKSEINDIEKQNKSVTVNFASDADLTISADQNLYGNITITDTGVVLTASRNVIVDTRERDVVVTNNTAQDLTVKTAAGSGFVVPAGFSLALRVDGANVVISKLMSAGRFSDQDMSTSGHKVIPSGDDSVPDTIIQWGDASFANGTTNVSLPIPYPTAHLQAYACNGGASIVGADFGASPNGLTSVSIYCESATDRTGRWFSIGN